MLHTNHVLPSIFSGYKLLKCISVRFYAGTLMHQNNSLHIHQDVAKALKNKRPVIALESTIITHGMPFPDNYRTALEVENIIRRHDVVPATIGVINGMIHVGMTNELLETLAHDTDVRKLSRRDLAVACANKLSGGTTVSATMLIAHRCGIKIFVTGGIGGVHRSGQHTMDVSADLRELGRSSMTVVSAGIKSILDVGRTLEYLETEGVTVATIGNSVDFPGFFTESSGIPSPNNAPTIDDAVALMIARDNLSIESGLLLAVPIPNEHADLGNTVERAIQTALNECSELKKSGNELTPFILQRVNQLTGGLSLNANILLIKNNAEVGAQLARSYYENVDSKKSRGDKQRRPTVVGGCNMDVISKCSGELLPGGPSNPSTVTMSFGGVGRNITEVLWRLNSQPRFLSVVGSDYNGEIFMKEFQAMGISGVATTDEHSTGVYNVVMDRCGEVFVATEDSSIHGCIDEAFVAENEEDLINSSMICVDANITEAAMELICSLCTRHSIPVLFEPTGVLKAGQGYMAKGSSVNAVTYMTPNFEELLAIYEAATGRVAPNIPEDYNFNREFILLLMDVCEPLLDTTSCIAVTLGKHGVFCATNGESGIKFVHYPISTPTRPDGVGLPISNVSGGGDSFAGAFIHGLLAHPGDIDMAVRVGLAVAQKTVRTSLTVSRDITEADGILREGDWEGRELSRED